MVRVGRLSIGVIAYFEGTRCTEWTPTDIGQQRIRFCVTEIVCSGSRCAGQEDCGGSFPAYPGRWVRGCPAQASCSVGRSTIGGHLLALSDCNFLRSHRDGRVRGRLPPDRAVRWRSVPRARDSVDPDFSIGTVVFGCSKTESLSRVFSNGHSDDGVGSTPPLGHDHPED